MDQSTIAHWMGHAFLNSTNKFLPLVLEKKRETLAKAKPLLKGGGKTVHGGWMRILSNGWRIFKNISCLFPHA
jgi:hypothetical protein